MIFIQVKKTNHGSSISNKKLHLFWNYIYFGINRK